MNLRTVWSEIVGAIHGIVGPDRDAVRPDEQALAPGSQKRAVAVEDDHRMLAAIEDKDAILRIGGHGR